MKILESLCLVALTTLVLVPMPANASPSCSARWPEIGELRLAPNIRVRIARGPGTVTGENGTRICLGDQISPSSSDGSIVRPDLPPIPIVHDHEIAIPTRRSTLLESLWNSVLRGRLLYQPARFIVHGTLGSDAGFALVGVAEGTAIMIGAPPTLTIPIVPSSVAQSVELRPPHDTRVFTAIVAAGEDNAEFRGLPILIGIWRLRLVGTNVIGAFSMTQPAVARPPDAVDDLGLDAASAALAKACLSPEHASLQSYQALQSQGRTQILRWQIPTTSLSCAIPAR